MNKCEHDQKNHGCDNPAGFVVEKTDLSHRKLNYCEAHALPYKQFPRDFTVTKIEQSEK